MLPEDLGVVEDLSRWPVEVQIALSLAIIAVVLAVRWLATRLIRGGSDILTEQQRWRITAARNLSTALIFVGLFVVWSREIEEFALSITAFAVAFVIAGKELILCLSGAAWRGATSAFGIGDWVEIGPYSGEVIDETALATILQEIHPTEFVYTGRTVAVPNSMLLSQAVVNHNFRKRYLLHEFVLHSEPTGRAPRIAEAIRDALVEATADFSEVAKRYAAVIEKRAGVELSDVEPTVRLGTTDLGKIVYRCALFCPRNKAAEMEQVAIRAFLAEGGAVEPGMG